MNSFSPRSISLLYKASSAILFIFFFSFSSARQFSVLQVALHPRISPSWSGWQWFLCFFVPGTQWFWGGGCSDQLLLLERACGSCFSRIWVLGRHKNVESVRLFVIPFFLLPLQSKVLQLYIFKGELVMQVTEFLLSLPALA